MTRPHDVPIVSSPLEGRIFRASSRDEVAEAVEQAFDYRGDVTVELVSGGLVEGYVFNRDGGSLEPYLELFPNRQAESVVIRYADIAAIGFTGKDTASGKSWEAWVVKKEAQRRVEAEAAEADARARGYL